MYKIMLDAGHGGSDGGATGKYIEKNINLEVVKKLKEKLENINKIQVFTTRETDTFVELSDRTNYANNIKADLFISVHHNSSIVNARGYEVIHSHIGGEGKRFADILCQEFNDYKTKHRGAFSEIGKNGRDRFAVIRHTNMPAVIGEFEFVQHEINVDEEVEAYFNAVLRFFNIKVKQTENEEHWGKSDFKYLNDNGITLHEQRFDEATTRAESNKVDAILLKRIVELEAIVKDLLEQ